MPTLTNQIASSALNGEGVQVNLDSTDRESLADLVVGAEVICNSSGKAGTIVSVDVFGTTFIVAPNNRGARFDSDPTPGLLDASETISY
jgi:hypothetical protein